MIDTLLNKNIQNFTIGESKSMLKKIGAFYCLKNHEEYVKRLQEFKNVLTFTWREEQKKVIDTFLKFEKKNYVIHGIFGCGKCHRFDTPIMLSNGKIKMVQDIKVGDLLMGDDSTPRTVVSLARGQDEMYEIIPIKGDKYTVNQEHILCLKATGYPRILNDKNRNRYTVDWIENNKFNSKSFTYNDDNKLLKDKEALDFIENISNEQIVEISVVDYLKLPKSRKTQLKTYRVPVDFPEQKVDIDPYMIGYWLGDGTSSGTRISTQDSNIIYYLKKELVNYNLSLSYISKYDYNIIGYPGKKGKNILLNTLKENNLINNKHIPDIYKYNSRENRLKLLAGLIDSDGYLKKEGGFEFVQSIEKEKLFDDVIYLARSLGFACYKSKKKTTHKYKGKIVEGEAWRIHINGEGIEEIPTKIPRKKAKARKQIKDVLVSGIKVKHVGRDNYYGFTLDGNCRYLLGDFTVTHNTTILLGLLIHGLLKELYKPDDVLFISFNVSIKNEIKRRLKSYGISAKVSVRTFDSIIYEIAKIGNYPYIDLPNFEGKRKFVYELCFNKEFVHIPVFQPKLIILDECQDLEKSTLNVLEHFYPNTKFVFAGDIFQSIQKEPRESILWYFMNEAHREDTYKIYMSLTPRVNPAILNTLKTSLKIYYPEFKDKIDDWKSGNTYSKADIEWKRLNSYTHIFEDLKTFLNCHAPQETMILTFSSAITVRGAMGDVARIRRFMGENNFKVNSDHKKLDPDTYFLSTANSSKGLERDYVIVFLTFPLELAFIHLSDDVVVNLITVALTRAKKKVIMYVPSYSDKFSRVLNLFENCPQPNREKIREGKTLKEFSFQDYIDIEHSPTELIRASVIKYDTRIRLREHMKAFNYDKMFDSDVSYKSAPIATEEERAFVGVLIENLMTSTWVGYWPRVSLDDKIKNNPMYFHVVKRISNNIQKYKQYTSSHQFNDINQYEGIYLYSQVHVALSNKLFIRLSDGLKLSLKNYWKNLKPKVYLIKPHDKKLKIQAPVVMPYISGIADATAEDDDGKTMSLYEIKASQDRNWVDNASLQIIIYALCCGKTWSRLHLLNPFQNSKISYYFDTKNILSLRKELVNDILVYNTNSFMAKLYPITKVNKKLNVSNTMFLNIMKNKDGDITQVSLLNMISPIKCEILYNKYVSSGLKKSKGMLKEDKYACESTLLEEDLLKELKIILYSEVHKDKVIWTFDETDIIYTNSICKFYNLKDFNDIVEYLNYKKNTDLTYSADVNDSFVRNIFCLSYLFLKNNFV